MSILDRTIALTTLVLPLAALAQARPENREALRACAEIEALEARLECIDDVLAQQEPAEAGASDEVQEASAQRREADLVGRREQPAPRESLERPSAGAASQQRPARPEDGGERSAVIVEVRSRIPGRAIFVTDSGEEFVQTSGSSRLFLPDVPFEAELRDGVIGGLFLVPPDNGPAIRVSVRD